MEDVLMRVGFLVPTLRIGGAEWVTIYCASHLAQAGLEIGGIAVAMGVSAIAPELLTAALALGPVFAARDGDTDERPGLELFADSRAATDALLQGCDAIVTWGVTTQSMLLKTWHGKVTVLLHSRSIQTKEYLWANIARANAIVAVCRDALALVPPMKLPVARCIFNSIPDWRLQLRARPEAVRAALGREPDDARKVVAFFGRLDGVKNIGLVFQTFESLAHRCTPVMCVAGELAGEYAALRTGTSRVLVAGTHDFSMADLVSAADIVVLPSNREGCSLTMLEAMAIRRSLVVSDVGAVRELPGSLRAKMDIVPLEGLLRGFPDALVGRLDRPTERPDYEPEYGTLFSPRVVGAQWKELLLGL